MSRVYDTPALQRLIYKPAQDMVIDELGRAGARTVLDVGCGTGVFAARLADELGIDVVGCDLSEGMLAEATAKTNDVAWVQGDSSKLPVAGASVDAVVCTEAFHWFDQPSAVVEIARVLRPGGIACIALINPRTEVGSELLRAQSSAMGTWPSRRRMRSLIEGAGLEVRAQHRVRRIFGYVLPTVLTVAARPS